MSVDELEQEKQRIADEIERFYIDHWPADPKKLVKQGERVPFPYIVDWYQTYGCNNWRKMEGLPMLRGKLNM